MDLHFTSAKASLEERAVVDAAASGNGTTRRHLLLPVLHAVQEHFGWISPGALNYVGERLRVAPADVYGVATFYAALSTTPKPKQFVHVCDDIACIGESEALISSLQHLGTAIERS